MLKLSLGRGATTAELVDALTQQYPVLADILPSCALSVNRKYLSHRQARLARARAARARAVRSAAPNRVRSPTAPRPRPASRRSSWPMAMRSQSSPQ